MWSDQRSNPSKANCRKAGNYFDRYLLFDVYHRCRVSQSRRLVRENLDLDRRSANDRTNLPGEGGLVLLVW